MFAGPAGSAVAALASAPLVDVAQQIGIDSGAWSTEVRVRIGTAASAVSRGR
jgi:hypothetical protein